MTRFGIRRATIYSASDAAPIPLAPFHLDRRCWHPDRHVLRRLPIWDTNIGGGGGRPDQRRPLSARTIRAAAQRRRNIPPVAISAVSRSALASLRYRHLRNHRPSAPSAHGDR